MAGGVGRQEAPRNQLGHPRWHPCHPVCECFVRRREGIGVRGLPGKGSGRREAFPGGIGVQTAPGFPQLPGAAPEVFLLVASGEGAVHVPAAAWTSGWPELRCGD